MQKSDLFEINYTDIHEMNGFSFSFPEVKDVTFSAGTKEAVHRWFRLTPSYSPEFVRHSFKKIECNRQTKILDPFLGKGTTLIECKKYGYSAFGVELNPLLKEVSEKALSWGFNIDNLIDIKKKVFRKIKNQIQQNEKLSCEAYCEKAKINVPIIHDPFRWWKDCVLKDLLIIREAIKKNVESELINPFWLALCVSSLDCANIHRNHPTISFDDDHTREINPFEDFREKVEIILEDLAEVKGAKKNGIRVFEGDSTQLKKVLKNIKVDRVITSPPYPNRFSYIHTTRPQMYFMEILEDISSATEIDLKAIGGTWGRATSVLMKEEVKPHKEIADFLCFRKELLEESLLMCNYATKYFNFIYEHIKSLKNCISNDFKGTYLVGNSRLKGIEIYTELYLAKIFESEGFKVDDIEIFRKRGGKKKLYESAVCVSKKN